MSKYQFVSSIRREINDINATIDRRIVRGRDYSDLARRHKELTRALRTIKQKTASGIFSFFFS